MELKNLLDKFGFNATFYGNQIAKVFDEKSDKKCGDLVLVTAMSPSQFGVGKTTVSIGLADALNALGKSAILSLREPSMGPVFGVKGGATGGGKSSLQPSQEIDLHFTGDFHAVAQANNLLASIIDNNIYFGTSNIDPQQIYFKRCLDINDRSLRKISYSIRGEKIETGFNITAASEVMAIVALSNGEDEVGRRLGDILVAKSRDGKPVFARDLGAQGAMSLLLKSALAPNAVKTCGGSLALVHMGPFANVAHGASSIVATRMALERADYCVTEAGFGCDLGGEKFVDITSRALGKVPSVLVLCVAVECVRAQGEGNLAAGFENVKRHIALVRQVFRSTLVVAINRREGDSEEDIQMLKNLIWSLGEAVAVCRPFEEGGAGCESLALEVIKAKKNSEICHVYELSDGLEEKIEKIAKNVYGAGRVVYSNLAKEKLSLAKAWGFENFYVNIAKTPLSFTHDKSILGAPTGFDFNISDIDIRSGAKMIVPIAGDMCLMPALGKKSRYLDML